MIQGKQTKRKTKNTDDRGQKTEDRRQKTEEIETRTNLQPELRHEWRELHKEHHHGDPSKRIGAVHQYTENTSQHRERLHFEHELEDENRHRQDAAGQDSLRLKFEETLESLDRLIHLAAASVEGLREIIDVIVQHEAKYRIENKKDRVKVVLPLLFISIFCLGAGRCECGVWSVEGRVFDSIR